MKYILLCIAILLSSCNVDTSLYFENNSDFNVEIYKSGNRIREYRLEKDSAQFRKLKKWASENVSGWEPTYVTFAPGVKVSSGQLSLNFLGANVIINSPKGQFAKPVKISDYEFLM
jgi:hypothetical protein